MKGGTIHPIFVGQIKRFPRPIIQRGLTKTTKLYYYTLNNKKNKLLEKELSKVN